MADNVLHIDDDWKRQAQEEKRRLAEAEARKKAEAASAPTSSPAAVLGGGLPGGAAAGAAPGGGASTGTSAGGTPTGRRRGGAPAEASFAGLVQSLMTQALFYLGELGTRSGQTLVDLDMAKLHIDMMGVLEEKTRGNLSDEEKQLLDTALYEVRMRFVAVAREYATV